MLAGGSQTLDSLPTPSANSVRGSIKDLFNFLSQFQSEEAANTLEASQAVKKAFREFLLENNYKLALKNFEALLEEKSGEKAQRNDGTVNWYHELVPILMILDLARKGKNRGGFNFKDLEPYGGLEVAIISHLRHDSAEDFITKEQLEKQMNDMRADLIAEDPHFDSARAKRQIAFSLKNIEVMTRQKANNPDGSPKMRADGKQEKEDIKDFSARMLDPTKSSPIVVMLKLADLIHNGATLLGAGKFDKAEKRRERCDMMENMYGPRFGIADHARILWPEFSNAIKKLDNTMGIVLYPHFRYLENVDLHYKEESDLPMGLMKYWDDPVTSPTSWSLSRAFNPVDISLIRMKNSVDPSDTKKYARLQTHIEMVIKRTLAPWKQHFPYLFQANDNNQGANGQPALRVEVA